MDGRVARSAKPTSGCSGSRRKRRLETYLSIAAFAKTLDRVDELHLLAYHKFGTGKYEGLGREYPMGDIEPPTDGKMLELKEAVEKYGLKCQIGG